MAQDSDWLDKIPVEPCDVQLRCETTGMTHRLFNVTFVGRSKALRPGVDLIIDNRTFPDANLVSGFHARIHVNHWPDAPPEGHSCPYEVRLFDMSLHGTDVDGAGVPADAKDDVGVLLDINQVVRFGPQELWVLEKAPVPARRVPPPLRKSADWKTRKVTAFDVVSLRDTKDWAGLSLYLGDLSQVAAGEVEIQDEAGEVLYHYRRCPDKVKHANAAAKKFGKLAYEGFVFKWVPSTQPRLIMEIQPHLKTKQQVFEKMINAIGE